MSSTPPAPPGGDGPRHLLVVDDNEVNRELLVRRLRRAGYAVEEAESGEDALRAVADRRPALVLLDLRMPGLDGWEATRRLKADPSTARIPVVAVTAHAMAGDREEALGAGCDGYATKPIDFPALLALVRSLAGPPSG